MHLSVHPLSHRIIDSLTTSFTLTPIGSLTRPYTAPLLFVQGYMYSSASRLVGVELSEEFVHLQNKIVLKYGMDARVQVSPLPSWRACGVSDLPRGVYSI